MNENQKIFAVVRFQFEALHYWPEASGEEAYLRHPHRHVFYVEAKVEQFHNNRDVEYIGLKRALQQLPLLQPPVGAGILNVGSASCEQLAEIYLRELKTRYPARDLFVSVFEDGENGAALAYFYDEGKENVKKAISIHEATS